MTKGKNLGIKIVVFLLVVVAYVVSLFFSKQIESLINKNSDPAVHKASVDMIKDGYIQMHFIYVGQGDCTVIELSDGKVMMIDTGDSGHEEDLMSYLDAAIFENDPTKTIDYLILTHTDLDHIAGAVEVLENYNVLTVYRPNETVPCTTKTWQNTVAAINTYADDIVYNAKDLTIEYDDPNSLVKDYKFTFLAPIQDSFSDTNDYSPFILFETYSTKVMFTGDASTEIEKDVLEYYKDNLSIFDVDILKAGHHGSKGSSCKEFLDATKPEYVVISCGIDNSYGHPHTEAVNRFTDAGSTIFRTDTGGNILAFIDNKGKLYFIGDYIAAKTTHIQWWYCGLTVVIIIGSALFIRKSKSNYSKRTDRDYK